MHYYPGHTLEFAERYVFYSDPIRAIYGAIGRFTDRRDRHSAEHVFLLRRNDICRADVLLRCRRALQLSIDGQAHVGGTDVRPNGVKRSRRNHCLR